MSERGGRGGDDRRRAAEGSAEQARHDVDKAGDTALGLHATDRIVEDLVAGTAQAGADHALCVTGGEAAGLEALGKREHVLLSEGVLELGQRAKRQA
jgi:hypothetical protein